jgi:hypothetical protein
MIAPIERLDRLVSPENELSLALLQATAGLTEAAHSLLSYDFGSSYAKLELLPGTSFMPGSGGGWTVSLLVVVDRR